MSNLGAMMTGGNPTKERGEHDFYSTPPECTRALMDAEGDNIPGIVWEPACGDGAISEQLRNAGRGVVSTDLIDRGYGIGGEDFLKSSVAPCTGMITNPPFSLAGKFILHAHSLAVPYIALLLKSTYWHAQKRQHLFKMRIPARIYALTWRPDFRCLGQPTMDCIWCVWDGQPKQTEYHLMRRPT